MVAFKSRPRNLLKWALLLMVSLTAILSLNVTNHKSVNDEILQADYEHQLPEVPSQAAGDAHFKSEKNEEASPESGHKIGTDGHCWCRGMPTENWAETVTKFGNTTCGRTAYLRGNEQRVVSFTYYQPAAESDKEKDVARDYFKGITDNLDLIKSLYPGYVMRLYFEGDDDAMLKLCDISCNTKLVDICPAKNNPRLGDSRRLYPLIWRFLPAVDPQVTEFHSRDLDSRISQRELAAVKEFLQSKKLIHVMRDNPNHGAPMMGGMWGAKLTSGLRVSFTRAFTDMFKNAISYYPREKGGYDQLALRRYIWPWAKRITMAHDSFTCRRFYDTRPFPTKREMAVGNYVGSIVGLQARVDEECPYKCRPKQHKDWTHC